jgi:hypothetical protein
MNRLDSAERLMTGLTNSLFSASNKVVGNFFLKKENIVQQDQLKTQLVESPLLGFVGADSKTKISFENVSPKIPKTSARKKIIKNFENY